MVPLGTSLTEDDAAAIAAAAVTLVIAASKGARAAMTYWQNRTPRPTNQPRLTPHVAAVAVIDRAGIVVVEAGGTFWFGRLGAFGFLFTANAGAGRGYECAPLSGAVIGDAIELVPVQLAAASSLPFAAPGGVAAASSAWQSASGITLSPQADGSYSVGGA